MLQMSIFFLIYIQWFRPIRSKLLTLTETFNEVISLVILYHMMSFSDAVQSAEIRYKIYGFSFIMTVCIYIAFHFTILFGDVLMKSYAAIKRNFMK